MLAIYLQLHVFGMLGMMLVDPGLRGRGVAGAHLARSDITGRRPSAACAAPAAGALVVLLLLFLVLRPGAPVGRMALEAGRWVLGGAKEVGSDPERPAPPLAAAPGLEAGQEGFRGALAVRSLEADGGPSGARSKAKAKAKSAAGSAASAQEPVDEGPPMAALMDPLGTPSRPAQQVLQVCVGLRHAVLLTDAGAVFTWGEGEYRCLGHGEDLSNQLLPKKVEMWAPGR